MTPEQIALAKSRGWTVHEKIEPANMPGVILTYFEWMWPNEPSSRCLYVGFTNQKPPSPWTVHLLTTMPIEDMKYAIRRMTRRRAKANTPS